MQRALLHPWERWLSALHAAARILILHPMCPAMSLVCRLFLGYAASAHSRVTHIRFPCLPSGMLMPSRTWCFVAEIVSDALSQEAVLGHR